MAEEAVPTEQQRKPDWRAELLWGTSLGVILGIFSACIYYFGIENGTPNLFNDQVGWIVYPLILALSFILTTLFRGRMTGSFDDGLRIVIIACLIQVLTTIILLVIFGWVFSFWEWDHYGLIIMLFGYDDQSGSFGYAFEAVLMFFIQAPLAILSALIGGPIGSRFLHRHRRLRPEGRAGR